MHQKKEHYQELEHAPQQSFSESMSHDYALFQLCSTHCAELHMKKRKRRSAINRLFMQCGEAMLQQIDASTSQLKEMGHVAKVIL